MVTPRELEVEAGDKTLCLGCFGEHEPDSEDTWIDFGGYRFRKPFFCLCCGLEICARQWAFGRACGKCDTGVCQSWHKHFRPEYGHANPPWYHLADGPATIAAAAEVMGAGPVAVPD